MTSTENRVYRASPWLGERCSLGDRLVDLLVLCPFTDLKIMTCQRFVFSKCIARPFAALMAIATVPSVDRRCWTQSAFIAVASACIAGMSVLPTMAPLPDGITESVGLLAYAHGHNGSGHGWGLASAFRPADDLGLPNRREPGGTR